MSAAESEPTGAGQFLLDAIRSYIQVVAPEVTGELQDKTVTDLQSSVTDLAEKLDNIEIPEEFDPDAYDYADKEEVREIAESEAESSIEGLVDSDEAERIATSIVENWDFDFSYEISEQVDSAISNAEFVTAGDIPDMDDYVKTEDLDQEVVRVLSELPERIANLEQDQRDRNARFAELSTVNQRLRDQNAQLATDLENVRVEQRNAPERDGGTEEPADADAAVPDILETIREPHPFTFARGDGARENEVTPGWLSWCGACEDGAYLAWHNSLPLPDDRGFEIPVREGGSDRSWTSTTWYGNGGWGTVCLEAGALWGIPVTYERALHTFEEVADPAKTNKLSQDMCQFAHYVSNGERMRGGSYSFSTLTDRLARRCNLSEEMPDSSRITPTEAARLWWNAVINHRELFDSAKLRSV